MSRPSNRPLGLTTTLALVAASLLLLPGAASASTACAVDQPPVPLGELVHPDGDLRADADRAQARAVEAVGQHLEEIPGDLELADVADDPAAHVDECGALSFVDHIEGAEGEGEARHEVEHAQAPEPGPAAAALVEEGADVFTLHSRPGAKFTIYLDFDGAVIPARNNWSRSYNGGVAMTAPAWSMDSDPSFNAAERAVIRDLWRATAEAYAPFEIDVTTEQPPAAALERTDANDDRHGLTALISRLPQVGSQCGGCSGIAYVGVAQWTGASRADTQPALAFEADAQTVIHELGHNFGLSHHADTTSSYHRGDAGWTPIMGSGSGHFLQWSKGDFPGSTTSSQDDLKVLSAVTPVRVDDHADTAAGATAYGTLDGHAVSGTIERAGDADRFLFTTTGTTGIDVELGDEPGLRAEVSLLDASGALVRRLDTLDSSRSGRWQQVSTVEALPAGTYQLRVRGIGLLKSEDRGRRSFADRSSYGSLGAYAVRIDDGGEVAPLTVSERRNTVRFPEGQQSRFVVGVPVGGIAPYTVTCGVPTSLVVCGAPDGGHVVPQARGTYTVPWTMTDARGDTVSGTTTVVVREASSATITGVEPVVEVGSTVRWELVTTGPAALGYSFSWGGLPPGVAWSSSEHAWTGTVSRAGTYTPRFSVTFNATWPEEKEAVTFDLPVQVRVVAPDVPQGPPPDPGPAVTPPPAAVPQRPAFVTKKTLRKGRVGKKYRATVVVTSGSRVSWKRAGGKKLPRGLTWKVVKKGSRTTVVISGRPKKAGTFTLKLRASNAAGARTKTFVVKVARR